MDDNSNLLINLSFVGTKPTGLATYALNLIPHLPVPQATALASSLVKSRLPENAVFKIYDRVPANLTPDQGTKGHLRRLAWTQFQLSQLWSKLRSQLLFSPIPEAPLFSRCRYVVTAHDLIPLRFPKRHSLLTPYFRHYIPQVLHQAQHIICNSQTTAQDIIRFFGIAAEKITPIPLAHNAQHFQFQSLPTRNYFLYVGRADPYKNLHRLIAAFAKLPNCHDYELWLAGANDRRYTPTLMNQAEDLGVAMQVKILEYIPYADLPTLINQAIALVFPSLWEGFGLPVLEAMACGTPVITSNLSSLPEVVGDAAVLVDPYQVLELTAAMQMVTDETVRSQLRQAGLSRAKQFSWVTTGKQTASVLQQYL